jgi:choline dehydrogenase
MVWHINGRHMHDSTTDPLLRSLLTRCVSGTVSSYQLWADAVGDQSFVFSNLLQYFKKSIKFTPPNYAKRGGAPVAYNSSVFSPSGGPLEVSFWNYFVPVSQNIKDGLQKLGFLENGNTQSGSLLGFAQFPATLQAEAQIRDSSETSFLQTAIRETDLQVYQRALAKKILFNGKTATGVLVNTAGLTYTLSARKEVILAAGPVSLG